MKKKPTSPFTHSSYKPPTKAQLRCLAEMGLNPLPVSSDAEAEQLIREHHEKWEKLPPTPSQRKYLQRWGYDRPYLTRGLAFDMIGKLKAGIDPCGDRWAL